MRTRETTPARTFWTTGGSTLKVELAPPSGKGRRSFLGRTRGPHALGMRRRVTGTAHRRFITGVIEMFRSLTDFGHQRTLFEAIGFYLAFLVLGIILGAVLGFLAGVVTGNVGFEGGLAIGTAVAIGVGPVLAFSIMSAKGLLNHLGYVAVAVLSVVGAAVGGLLLGLVFVAFLTTRPSVRRSEPVEVGPTFA